MFLSYDSDGNQSLDLAEFRLFYADLVKILDEQGWKDEKNIEGTDVAEEVFKQVDRDNSGTISFLEFKSFLTTMSMAYSMASMMNDW